MTGHQTKMLRIQLIYLSSTEIFLLVKWCADTRLQQQRVELRSWFGVVCFFHLAKSHMGWNIKRYPYDKCVAKMNKSCSPLVRYSSALGKTVSIDAAVWEGSLFSRCVVATELSFFVLQILCTSSLFSREFVWNCVKCGVGGCRCAWLVSNVFVLIIHGIDICLWRGGRDL